jgi:anti-sigma regulatory factor (Ser/Thr protein kinase)
VDESEDITIDLPSDLDAPAIARRFVDEHSDHLPRELIADAALLVTELVTNAVRHGRPQITLQVCLEPPRFGVLVKDAGTTIPTSNPQQPGADATGGRGLVIVDRLSAEWGVIPTQSSPGKTVWFELTAATYE